MATAAFKSNTRRGNGYGGGDSPKKNPNPMPQKQRLRRSLSVNALSRSTQIDISSEFSNKRDNPLYWAAGGSPPAEDDDVERPTTVAALESRISKSSAGQRGRSVARNWDLGSSSKKGEENFGRKRSLSRVNDSGAGTGGGVGRRGRSVSRGNSAFRASESNVEQESVTSNSYGGRSNSIRASNNGGKLPVSGGKTSDKNCRSRDSTPSRHPSVESAFDSQAPNWEDEISTSSFSEAEEKTIKAVCEQMKSFQEDNSREKAASNEIYETVRSEVRRAIADIQNDIDHAVQRKNTGTLASLDVEELVLDIRREYAKKLEESLERARKLRSDLAIEEHHRQELSRILQETLPEPKASISHRSRFGRKSSSERKKMSKRLTDEAMSYFDECVSISTFDSSDFSATEDSAANSIGTDLTMGVTNSYLNHKQLTHAHSESASTANSRSNELVMDHIIENTHKAEKDTKFRFSFNQRQTEHMDLQQDIRNYIKTFEKDIDKNKIDPERSRTNRYNLDSYDLLDVKESLLFDKVIFKNAIDSGRLHICGEITFPFLPFA